MIAIIDYGMGNLRSVQKAIEHVGADAKITQDPNDIRAAQKVILPGVGAMAPAMEKLAGLKLKSVILDAVHDGKPFLGICLGFQLLFQQSREGGATKGLEILEGTVERFSWLKVPQIGWNQLHIVDRLNPLFKNITEGAYVYFCHSYFAKPKDTRAISTTSTYGIDFASSVRVKNVFGVQFHPEKSQSVGLTILKNFCEL